MRVADELRAEVLASGLTRLGSERELVGRFGVSRFTVRQALGVLQAEGLVEPVQGRGVFVRESVVRRRMVCWRRLAEHSSEPADSADAALHCDEVKSEVSRVAAPGKIAERLGVAVGTVVLARRRQRVSAGRPVKLATTYLPLELARETVLEALDVGPGGPYARLAEFGHVVTRFETELRTRMPLPEEAHVLRVGTGVPVLRVVRTALDAASRPLGVDDLVLAGDRYELVFTTQTS